MVIFFGLNLIKKYSRNVRVISENLLNIISAAATKPYSVSSRLFYCETPMNTSMSSTPIFNFSTDRFQGVTVKDEAEFSCDVEQFSNKLKHSLDKWVCDGIRTVWFYISLQHSMFIPILTQNGFVFHRVNDASGQTLVLSRWLPKDKPSTIPPYAHTMVGVGGIVVNNKDELLTVYQSYGKYETWKLPGGYVEPRENLTDAVIREVEEETGIKTKFQSCVLFRHTHQANFDCSDLYFITVLEPLTEEASEDSEEVLKVQWMPIEEFLNHPHVHELNKLFIRIYLQQKENKISIEKHDGIHPVTKKPYTLYYASANDHCL
ncbi:uncharacterized protein LOC135843147 [Planococcus citri]|uniref:uncharacterized protein LOC135843147 n=1 Tax=Planococcus citri TaxID=170843 RepID=UPI0031F9616D